MYTGNVAAKTLGDYTTSQILLGNTDNTSTYKIIEDGVTSQLTKDGNDITIYKLDYDKVKTDLNLEVKSNGTGDWYIDEYGIVYLLYGDIDSVPTYYKENNAIITSLSNFVTTGEITTSNNNNNNEDNHIAVVGTIVTYSNKTIDGEDPAYNNPIIPVGFKAVNTTDATWGNQDAWNNGLVIEDEDGNQFVWIPVDGTTITYARLPEKIKPIGDYEIEPTDAKDDTLPTGVTSESEQITNYGGFYVARYEASLPNALVDLNSPMADNNSENRIKNEGVYYKPESKLNGFVWNYINYTNAKSVSENAYKTDYVKSGLLTGRQWDTMLRFIEQTGVNIATDSSNWGNYYDKTGYTVDNGYYKAGAVDTYASSNYTSASKTPYTKSANGYLLLTTGTFGDITNNHPKNLYDVAGNMWEWTNERVATKGGSSTAVDNPLLRGGSFCDNGSSSAACRFGGIGTGSWGYNLGFRLVLYIL